MDAVTNDKVVGGYVHRGRFAALVSLKQEGGTPSEETLTVANKIAQQVVASNPKYITAAEAPKKDTKKEQKPSEEEEEVDVVLEDQEVVGANVTVKEYLQAQGQKANATLQVQSFVRLVCGEGVEKKQQDFAAEVKKLAS